MSFTNVKPTQPELDSLKKRRKFYDKGESLLEIKREQLLNSIRVTIKLFFKQRELLQKKIVEAFRLLELSYENIGERKVNAISYLNKIHYKSSVNVTYYNKLGTDIPKITYELAEGSLPSYSFTDTPMHLDFLNQHLKDSFQDILKLAELDAMLYSFTINFHKIERRINALKNIMIPRITKLIDIIEEILFDNSQEEFVRLKKIKAFLEQKASIL
jgi:V/A-type H+-transporting ATPase subunit D